MNSLEKVVAYYKLQNFLSPEEWNDLGNKLGIADADHKRIWGRDIEDSFYLLVLTYEKVRSIILLEETISQLSNLPTADCILVLLDGRKLLVEIKATKETLWKISQGRLSRQEELAQQLDLELYYAVFMNGYWGIFSAAYVREQNFKISITPNFADSKFNDIFDPQIIRIPKGLTIKRQYSQRQECLDLGPKNEKYGYCTHYWIDFNGTTQELRSQFHLMCIAVIERALTKHRVEQVDDDTHMVILETDEVLDVYDYNIILAPVYTTMASLSGRFLTSSSFIVSALENIGKQERTTFIDVKKRTLEMLNDLSRNGFPFEIIHWSKVREWTYIG